MIVLNNLDVAVPVGEVSYATAQFCDAIKNWNQPRGPETLRYEVFYLSSCFFGLTGALVARKGLSPRAWELANYGAFAVGAVGYLRVKLGHFEAARQHVGTPTGRRQWWLGVAGVTVCSMQGLQCLWVACNWNRTHLPLLGLGTRAVGIGACLTARSHKRRFN